MARILLGFSNNYNIQAYENSKNDKEINLTLIIKSKYQLEDNKINKALKNLKDNVKNYYNKLLKWKMAKISISELSINKLQGIAKYTMIIENIKEIKNG